YDRANRRMRSARAPMVFLCASTLESTRILLSSGTDRSPGGIGSRSNALGANLMDHVILSGVGEGGRLPDEPIDNIPGRCVYLPRFDLRHDADAGVQTGGSGEREPRFSVQLHRWSTRPGRSHFVAVSFSEMAPRPDNRVRLDPDRKDAFGLPVLRIDCRHRETELRQASAQSQAIGELGKLFDIDFIRHDTVPAPPGTALHECGTARMGDDPATSVLDPNGQCWDAKGLYVTDGSAFVSQGLEHPTLTIMALTARACQHALTGSTEVDD
ncbi:MAG: GMC oxidoreductase, partial [Pseudomonadota bacterium]